MRMQNPRGCWEERQLRVKEEVLVPGEGTTQDISTSHKFWNLLLEACGSTSATLPTQGPAVSLAYA